MKSLFREFYSIDETTIANMWDDCVFVIDTNVLLNLYRFTEKSQADALNVLEKLASRIWIPHQVALEYQRNRPIVIAGQLSNFHRVNQAITDAINSLEGEFNKFDIKRNRNVIDTASFIEKIRKYASEFKAELDGLKSKRKDVHEEDLIRDKYDQLFANNIGGPMSEDELKAIQKEGDSRFSIPTPPGFADITKKDSYTYGKARIEAKYGDLIVWKQIIKHAKENSIKKVIFITDDDKEDWWWIVNSSGGKTLGIRPEIRQEIFSDGGVEDFYMYNSARFIERGMVFLKIPVETDSINQIQEVVDEQNEKGNNVNILTGRLMITEDIFLENLDEAVSWAKRSKNGYVGLLSFIRNFLENKGYNFKQCFQMAIHLEKKGIIFLSPRFDSELQREVVAMSIPSRADDITNGSDN